MMKGFLGGKTTVVSQPFKEGSGNNMILGQWRERYPEIKIVPKTFF